MRQYKCIYTKLNKKLTFYDHSHIEYGIKDSNEIFKF